MTFAGNKMFKALIVTLAMLAVLAGASAQGQFASAQANAEASTSFDSSWW